MQISYFFRHPAQAFHSIEEQFFAIQKKLPAGFKFTNHFAKFPSQGLFKRIYIAAEAAFRQSEVNHITGDIHFVAFFLRKSKTVLTIHDIGSILSGNPLKTAVLKLFWFTIPVKRVKYISVISEFTKKQLLKNLNISAQKIVVIPDCVSPEITPFSKQFNVEKPTILQIGTKINKNLPNLFEALAGINCKLIIVGKLSDSQLFILKEKAIDYNNFVNISFTKVIALYRKCDVVSFVSTYEGFGVPILEAQATGRAVITAKRAPMQEVAGNGAALVNPDKPSEIRAALLKIIENTAWRESLIAAGFKNVKNYSAQNIAARYAALYKRVKNENKNG